ncbi:MAG: T9SS type A sorting domain-containing protein [Chitinophagaceae bacterium]|nr:T9SS type A sorting domain-containing protein [Chitinophagaceae bacterium]
MENDEQQLSIYPNPCQDFVVLKHRADQHQLRIYNTMGQIVLEHKLSPTKEEKIQLQQLVTGIYIVEIEDSQHQLQRTKLMKW